MPKTKVTDRALKSLKPQDAIYERGYGGGFYVRVFLDDRKVARYRYQLAGKTRILTLGESGQGATQKTLAKLLKAHAVAQGKVAQAAEDYSGRQTDR